MTLSWWILVVTVYLDVALRHVQVLILVLVLFCQVVPHIRRFYLWCNNGSLVEALTWLRAAFLAEWLKLLVNRIDDV